MSASHEQAKYPITNDAPLLCHQCSAPIHHDGHGHTHTTGEHDHLADPGPHYWTQQRQALAQLRAQRKERDNDGT